MEDLVGDFIIKARIVLSDTGVKSSNRHDVALSDVMDACGCPQIFSSSKQVRILATLSMKYLQKVSAMEDVASISNVGAAFF